MPMCVYIAFCSVPEPDSWCITTECRHVAYAMRLFHFSNASGVAEHCVCAIRNMLEKLNKCGNKSRQKGKQALDAIDSDFEFTLILKEECPCQKGTMFTPFTQAENRLCKRGFYIKNACTLWTAKIRTRICRVAKVIHKFRPCQFCKLSTLSLVISRFM